MPWLLYPSGKSHQYALNMKLGKPQSLSGHFGDKKDLLPLLKFEPWIVQPVAQSLYGLG